MNELEKIHAMNAILDRIDRMNDQIEINTRKLNDAIKEMRGLVGFVRPLARKNAWYGDEIEGKLSCGKIIEKVREITAQEVNAEVINIEK